VIGLGVEPCIEYLQADYFSVYAAGETGEGSSSKEVLHDSRNKSVKEEMM